MFPARCDNDLKDSSNINIALFGNRILSDQTLYEYLIEFLQVFISAKDAQGTGKRAFHTQAQIQDGTPAFYVDLRVGLRRFVFYNRSKQESRSEIDTLAYESMEKLLRRTAQDGEEDIDLIHDLLLNDSIVTRNRGWYAQSLMPVAPELIMAELQGIKARQRIKNPQWDDRLYEKIDSEFDYSKHNFLARGGQVLYLHLLQGILSDPDKAFERRRCLEALLNYMLDRAGAGTGRLAHYIQDNWEDKVREELSDDNLFRKYYDAKRFNLGYIVDDYSVRSERFVDEVTTFLSADIHPIARIELLGQGLVLSLLRVMQLVADKKISKTEGEPVWIADMSKLGGTSNLGKLSAQSYSYAYETFQSALLKVVIECLSAAIFTPIRQSYRRIIRLPWKNSQTECSLSAPESENGSRINWMERHLAQPSTG